jgi:AcrR family transcriptional regulator
LVKAAVDLADKRGYEQLTLRSLAEHFRIKPPSIYNHIGSLAALRRELHLEALRHLTSRVARAAAGRTEADATRQLANAWRAFSREHPSLHAALVHVTDESDQEARVAAEGLQDVVTDALSGYGAEGNDAIHSALALRSAIHGFIALEAARTLGPSVDRDKAFDYLVELVIAGLRSQVRGGVDGKKRAASVAKAEPKPQVPPELRRAMAKRRREAGK